MGSKGKAVIIGTGIGGLATAVALQRTGWKVHLFEQADELRVGGSGLSVMCNASSAMKTLGIDLQLERFGAPIKCFEIRNEQGRLLKRMPASVLTAVDGTPSVCISRRRLQEGLLAQLADDTEFSFGKRAQSIEEDAAGVSVSFADGSQQQGDVLIGADGFHSATRRALGLSDTVRRGGFICWLGLIPFADARIKPGDVIHYWGKGRRFGILDVGDGMVYWWATANMASERIAAWQGTREQVADHYAGWPALVRDLILATDDEAILSLEARDRAFSGGWGRGRATLLGDAAHPMMASLGQGAGMCIEDAAVLAHCLAEQVAPATALRRYEALREPRTRMVVESAWRMSRLEQAESVLPRLVRNGSMYLLPRRILAKQMHDLLHFHPGMLP